MPLHTPSVRFGRLLTALAIALCVAACGSSGVQGGRPTTNAILQIVSPTPNEVTGPNVVLQMKLTNAVIVPAGQAGGKIDPTKGHIHVALDGKLISLASGTSQPVTGLTPGIHTLQASFVASDHLPFANEVVTAVIFTVK
jgi:hypothetical protein